MSITRTERVECSSLNDKSNDPLEWSNFFAVPPLWGGGGGGGARVFQMSSASCRTHGTPCPCHLEKKLAAAKHNSSAVE